MKQYSDLLPQIIVNKQWCYIRAWLVKKSCW